MLELPRTIQTFLVHRVEIPRLAAISQVSASQPYSEEELTDLYWKHRREGKRLYYTWYPPVLMTEDWDFGDEPPEDPPKPPLRRQKASR